MKRIKIAVLIGLMMAGCGTGSDQAGNKDSARQEVSKDSSRTIIDTMAVKGDTAVKEHTKVDSMR